MVRTKQTTRKESDKGSGMERAEFPEEASQSEDPPSSPSQMRVAEPQGDMQKTVKPGWGKVSQLLQPVNNVTPRSCCPDTHLSVVWTRPSLSTTESMA